MDPLDIDKTMQSPDGGEHVASLQPNTTLGQYRIIKLLGRGGMGEVYLAEHVHLQTRHALKIILPEHASSPGFQDRFEREAQVMAKLTHPHIVGVTDSGYEDGVQYLVMDYIVGPRGEPMDLRQLIDERTAGDNLMDEDEAVAVGLEICEALAYAHSYKDADISNGIVHRDLKPANILLDADTKLYVTDFGLARLIGPDFERSVIENSVVDPHSMGDDRTMNVASSGGGRVGTFGYMSPEQLEGRPADLRSDVYAMGVILYELLTGRKVVGVPQKPSKVRAELKPGWDELLLEKCLAYAPVDRFQDALEVIDAIDRLERGVVQDLVSKESPREETGRPSATGAAEMKRKAGVGKRLLAAACVLLVMITGYVLWPKPAATQRSETTSPPPIKQHAADEVPVASPKQMDVDPSHGIVVPVPATSPPSTASPPERDVKQLGSSSGAPISQQTARKPPRFHDNLKPAIVLTDSQQEDEVRLEGLRGVAILRGVYRIPTGKTLFVGEGVVIKAEKGAFLDIRGTLRVEGTEAKPVEFSGAEKSPGYWIGICGKPQDVFIRCALIRDAKIGIELPKGTIENCVIMGNNIGVRVHSCAIRNCILEKNTGSAIRCDVHMAVTTIENCTVVNNGLAGRDRNGWKGAVFGKFVIRHSIVARNKDVGLGEYRHGSVVEDCIVEDNRPYDFATVESDMQVRKCWLGDRIQSIVEKEGYGINLDSVFDKHDGRSGNVVFTPGPKKRPEDCGAKLELSVSY